MRPRSTHVYLLGIVVAAVLAGSGCSFGEGGDDFEQEVVSARDTADSSFAYIKRPQSTEDLVRRLRTSRDRLERVSGSLAETEAPDELTDERERLVTALEAMAKEMDGFANSIELVIQGREQGAPPVETLVFDSWDQVQNVLTELRGEGVDVQPLRPGGGA
jgi:hypothetical protein